MKILFRADASILIGNGHVMRCLSLADELKRQGHECYFVCREHAGHLGNLIIQKGYQLILLPISLSTKKDSYQESKEVYADWLGVSWHQDALQTHAAIVEFNPDWLVVDHYALDYQWQRALASVVGKIMVIDDLANRQHDCTILLDQNLGRMPGDYSGLVPPQCKVLIGPNYALLRSEFSAIRQKSIQRRKSGKLQRILISFGGVDLGNMTSKVLDALANSNLSKNTELDVILGVSSPHILSVQKQVANSPFNAKLSIDVEDMAERMSLADLAIGAVGSSVWERCCLGLPSIVFVLSLNQEKTAENLILYGISKVLYTVSDLIFLFEDHLKVSYFINEMDSFSKKSIKTVDGLGCSRVADSMIDYNF